MRINKILIAVAMFLSFACSEAETNTRREPAATAGDADGKINLATYNIRYYATSDSLQGDKWQTRSKVIADLVRFHEFDIFGTQEGLRFQLNDLRNKLRKYDYIGHGRDDGKESGEHAAIFYRPDKFEVLDQGDFWLSETPDKPGKGWDAICYRICTLGQIPSSRIRQGVCDV